MQEDVNALRRGLAEQHRRAEALAVRCALLEGTGFLIGCTNVLGNAMTVVGGILLSYAGAAPSLFDAVKANLSGVGVATAICGSLLVLVTFAAGYWVQRARR